MNFFHSIKLIDAQAIRQTPKIDRRLRRMTAEFVRTLADGQAGFPALLDAIEAYLESSEVPPIAAAQLMVAFDEIISNILNHGGKSGQSPTVDVSMGIEGAVDGGRIRAEVTDDGQAFDPLAAPPPDTGLSLDERAIGGLGIHLVRKLMTEVAYVREAGRNRLRFSKNYTLD